MRVLRTLVAPPDRCLPLVPIKPNLAMRSPIRPARPTRFSIPSVTPILHHQHGVRLTDTPSTARPPRLARATTHIAPSRNAIVHSEGQVTHARPSQAVMHCARHVAVMAPIVHCYSCTLPFARTTHNVRPGRCPRVGANHHPALKRHGHDGCLRVSCCAAQLSFPPRFERARATMQPAAAQLRSPAVALQRTVHSRRG
jgi:hypothetical protein